VNFLRFSAPSHIVRVNCAEVAGDGPGQPAYDIFLAQNIHFQESKFRSLKFNESSVGGLKFK